MHTEDYSVGKIFFWGKRNLCGVRPNPVLQHCWDVTSHGVGSKPLLCFSDMQNAFFSNPFFSFWTLRKTQKISVSITELIFLFRFPHKKRWHGQYSSLMHYFTMFRNLSSRQHRAQGNKFIQAPGFWIIQKIRVKWKKPTQTKPNQKSVSELFWT